MIFVMTDLPICRCGTATSIRCFVCNATACSEHSRRLSDVGTLGSTTTSGSAHVCDECGTNFTCFACGGEGTRRCGCGRPTCELHSLLEYSSGTEYAAGAYIPVRTLKDLRCVYCIRHGVLSASQAGHEARESALEKIAAVADPIERLLRLVRFHSED